MSTINMVQHAFGKSLIKESRNVSNVSIKNNFQKSLIKSKRLNYNDLTYSSFYQDTNQTQDNIGNCTFYKNSGCRINTDGAGNIHLVESNANDARTIDNSLSVMKAFYQKSQNLQNSHQKANSQNKEADFPFEVGQIVTARRTAQKQQTGHSSETTLAFNRSGVQLQCYDNSQFSNNSNMLFQITGQKMFNNKTGQVGLVKSRKNKKAKQEQSLVRQEKMRKYQNNYMIGAQKLISNQKITPELCDRSISAKNSIEGGNSVESYIFNARNILKGPQAVKQPKEIIIRIKKEEKEDIITSQNDNIFVNNEGV